MTLRTMPMLTRAHIVKAIDASVAVTSDLRSMLKAFDAKAPIPTTELKKPNGRMTAAGEAEIKRMIEDEGMKDVQVAKILDITPAAVRLHRNKLMTKNQDITAHSTNQ